MNTKELAERATIQSFLNCYIRETGNYSEDHRYNMHSQLTEKTDKIIVSSLALQHIELIIPVKYWSLTGRHLFDFPIYFCTKENDELKPIDYVTLTAFIVKELLLAKKSEEAEDELMLRVILSCRSIHSYIENRVNDADELTAEDFDYIEAEQSLLLGHLLHPTPKSKQGLTEAEEHLFTPELKGEFQLHYFRVDNSFIMQGSSKDVSAGSIMLKELEDDPAVDQIWLKGIQNGNDRVFIPVHPLQVKTLLSKEKVQALMAENRMEYLGPLGKLFTATSSFRTVFSAESKYMFKFSVPVKITNSQRINQQKELERGVEVTRLLETEVGQQLAHHFPGFKVIQDPAYLNVNLEEEISGFEMVIRDNPFYKNSAQTTLIAGLCQDLAFGGKNRLHAIIEGIAKKENRKAEDVSIDWFNQYLSLTLDPMIWLFHTYGIALEAHQQNSLIQLEEGYPKTFYYRDNQGYYYCDSHVEKLKELLPGLNQKSDTVCADHVAEERLRYYFFFNHLFGLINGFGTGGLIEEEKLIDALKHRLELHEQKFNGNSNLLSSLLYQPALPCKANLLTRLNDMDELVGPMEAQSVYTMVKNPLVKEVEIHHVI